MKKILIAAALFLCSLGYASAQSITVQSGDGKTVSFSRADLEALPHIKVTAGKPDQQAVFEGTLLKNVLEKAGGTFGESLRGKRLASYVLVEAADNYRVVIALPELDPDFTDKQIILALTKDGKPLDAKEGPYRIVIPDEKRMARWVRQVTAIKVLDAQ